MLKQLDYWLFDLDHTLYPYEAEIMHLVSERMTVFVQDFLSLDYAEARNLQKAYLADHGTTLRGLMINHGVDPRAFMDFVHDVPLGDLEPDHELNALIMALPGQKLVFTNADHKHSQRILDHLMLSEIVDHVFHLEHADLIPKPDIRTFELMISKHTVEPGRAIFFEDTARNLKPAKSLGMTTVLVGPHAVDDQSDFVDFRSPSLKAFLADNFPSP
jgi:putative hydrolase of the HAD superfamily